MKNNDSKVKGNEVKEVNGIDGVYMSASLKADDDTDTTSVVPLLH